MRGPPAKVYFIRPIGMEGPVKIGHSQSPDGRRETLETWAPFALEIVAEIDGGRVIERRFHAYFLDTHQRREWFAWSPKLAATIDAINAGTFPLSELPAPKRLPSYVMRRPWTDEQRLRASYNHRASRTLSFTGFICNCDHGIRLGDPETIAELDRYFEAPHIHGRPVNAPWAAERQREYLARLQEETA